MPLCVFSRSSVRFLVASGTISVVWLTSIASAGGQARRAEQTAQEEKVQMAEDVFTNVQLLKGIPVKEFMGTMGFFSAATGMNCTQCHVEESGGSWAKYADESPLKLTARRMIVMMNAINQTYFGGRGGAGWRRPTQPHRSQCSRSREMIWPAPKWRRSCLFPRRSSKPSAIGALGPPPPSTIAMSWSFREEPAPGGPL